MNTVCRAGAYGRQTFNTEKRTSRTSCLLSDILVMQPAGRALTSDWSENSFIMVAYKK